MIPGMILQLRLTRKVNGKSVAESFFNPAAFEKAKREVDEFHRFQRLTDQLIELNEKRDLFPNGKSSRIPRVGHPRKKKRRLRSIARVAREIQAFLQVTFAADRKGEGTDMEALETGTRDALHRAGAVVLSRLLEANPGPTATQVPCACGQSAQYHDVRSKQIMTVLGKAELKRAYYVCPRCHKGQSPRDRELDVEGTAFFAGTTSDDGDRGE